MPAQDAFTPGASWGDPFHLDPVHIIEGLQDMRNEALGIKTDKLARTFRMLQATRDKQDVVLQAAAILIQRYVRKFLRRCRVQRLVRKFATHLLRAVKARRAAAGVPEDEAVQQQEMPQPQDVQEIEVIPSLVITTQNEPESMAIDNTVPAPAYPPMESQPQEVQVSQEAACLPEQQPPEQVGNPDVSVEDLPAAASSYFYPSEPSISSRGQSTNGGLPKYQASRGFSSNLYEPRDPPAVKPPQQHLIKAQMTRAPVTQHSKTPREIQVSQFYVEQGQLDGPPAPPAPAVPMAVAPTPQPPPAAAAAVEPEAPQAPLQDSSDSNAVPQTPLPEVKGVLTSPPPPARPLRGAVAVGQLCGSAIIRCATPVDALKPSPSRPVSQQQQARPPVLTPDMLLAVGAGLGQRWSSPTPPSRGSVRPANNDRRSVSPVPAWDTKVSSPMHRQLISMCVEESSLAIMPGSPSSPPNSNVLQSRTSSRAGTRSSKQVLHLSTAGLPMPQEASLQNCFTDMDYASRPTTSHAHLSSHELSQRSIQLSSPQRQPSIPLVSSPVMAAFQKLMAQQQPHSAPTSPKRARSLMLEEQSSEQSRVSSSRGALNSPTTSTSYIRGKSVDWVVEGGEAPTSASGALGSGLISTEVSGISSTKSRSIGITPRGVSSRNQGALKPSHLNSPTQHPGLMSTSGRRVQLGQPHDTFTPMMVASSSLPAIHHRSQSSQGYGGAAGGTVWSDESDHVPAVPSSSPGQGDDGVATSGFSNQAMPTVKPSRSGLDTNAEVPKFTFSRML